MAACDLTCWAADCCYTLKSEIADARVGRSILSATLRKSQINHPLTQLAFCLLLDCCDSCYRRTDGPPLVSIMMDDAIQS